MTTLAAHTKLFNRSKRVPLALGLCVCALLAGTATYNGFTLPEWWRDLHSGVVRSHGVTSEKVVALTFDDGPDPNYTPRILETLHRYSVPATFFEEGRMVQRYPQLARRVVAQGNAIGNHTFSHPYLARLSPQAVHQEVDACERCLEQNVGVTTTLFRPPRGDWNPTIYRETVHDHDHLILWSIALEHHDVPTPQAMAQRVLEHVRPGDIILMHDGTFPPRETTVQALPLLLAGLQKRGYRCVTIPELLHLQGNSPTYTPAARLNARK